jgi:general secretion pathway protein M
MKTLKLTSRDSRIAAIGLLLLALMLAYFLLLHWWFVAPLRDIGAQMDDLRDTQSRYAAAIAEKPQLQRRIAALGAGRAASDAFLPEHDPNTATADLMQRVVDAVNAHAEGGTCTVTQKMPVPEPSTASGEPYRKAAVSINLSCDIEPLVGVLQSLEQGTPYLFVDNLNIYRNPVAARQENRPSLEVQFALSGYLRPADPAAPAPAASEAAAGDAADAPGAMP